jgi:hypothetical protein
MEEKEKEEDFCEVGFQTKYMVSKALGHGLYWNQACAWLCLMWALIPVKPIAKGLPCLKMLLKFYCFFFFFFPCDN